MKKKIMIALVMILLAAVAVMSLLDRIALYALSKVYGTDISYSSMKKDAREGYIFENLKVMNKKIGLGLYCTRASLKPLKKIDFWKSMDYDFKLKDVHFIKQRAETPRTTYGSPEDLVAMPFEGRWKYKDVTGTVEIFSNGMTLKRLEANGSQIRLFVSGDIFYSGAVDTNITVLFSKEVLKDIPQELHSIVMNDEPKEWKSFSVKVKGNLKSPSIQISGKLFRLNVGTMVVRD